MTPDRLRALRRPALNVAFGLSVFMVAAYLSFPYERAKEIAIRLAAQKDLDVEIGSAGPAFGLAVAFHDILVRTRPTPGAPGAPSKPTRFFIDAARVSASPWSLLSSSKGFSVALTGFGGRVDFDQRGTPGKKGAFATEIRARDVKMAELPGVKDALNIPLAGTLKLDLRLKSETGKYADASGEITFSCVDCVIGDGKTPLKVAGNPFLAGGLTLPRTRLGDFGGHVAIDKGVGKLQGVEAKSPDLEVTLEGEVTLHDPLPTSTVNAYLRFKLTDAFLAKATAVQAMLQMVGAQGKRPDGFYGVRIGGRLGQMSPPVLTPVSPIATSAIPVRPSIRASTAPYPSPAAPPVPIAPPPVALPPGAPVPAPSPPVEAPPPTAASTTAAGTGTGTGAARAGVRDGIARRERLAERTVAGRRRERGARVASTRLRGAAASTRCAAAAARRACRALPIAAALASLTGRSA